MALSPLNLINNLAAPVLDRGTGFFKIGNHIELINEAVVRLVFTRKGTRMGNLKYGTTIPDLPFTADWLGMENMITYSISEALALWEPRVQFTGITLVYLQTNAVAWTIEFIELVTNSSQNVPVLAEFID